MVRALPGAMKVRMAEVDGAKSVGAGPGPGHLLSIGVAGWDYADWRGIVYPRRQARSFDRLAHLARSVDVMEVNATFYAPVAARHAEGWVARTEDSGLRFVAKLWQPLTHDARWPEPEAVREWARVLEPLRAGGRLLGVLVQFPFSFRPGPAAFERLGRLREILGEDRPFVEFRHRAWLEEAAQERVLASGYPHQVAIDMPQRGGTMPPRLVPTEEPVYVRLHGRNAAAWFDPSAGRDQRYDHLYRPEELQEWADRLRETLVSGRTTVLIGNNHFQGKALHAVLTLAHLLEPRRRPVPDGVLARHPELAATHRPPPGELF